MFLFQVDIWNRAHADASDEVETSPVDVENRAHADASDEVETSPVDVENRAHANASDEVETSPVECDKGEATPYVFYVVMNFMSNFKFKI